MSHEQAPRTSRNLHLLGVLLLAFIGLYVFSYLILSRWWRSDLEAALGPNHIDGVTCYVPVDVLFTPKGYGWHCALSGFYEPLWRSDRALGGPAPIAIFQGIGKTKEGGQ